MQTRLNPSHGRKHVGRRVSLAASTLALAVVLTLIGALSTLLRAQGEIVVGDAVYPDTVYQDNVVVVLDASGSMSKKMRGSDRNKLETAKTALLSSLGGLPETTNIGVLVFSASNVDRDWIYPLGRLEQDRLRSAIHAPQPGHKTPLGRYMKRGADALLEQRKAQKGYGSYRLLIVTDGEANDRHLVDKYLPDIVSRGISVDVIGVMMKSNHTLATRVHSYRKANDAKALATALTEVFAEVSAQTDDSAGQESFEIIAPLPDAMAVSMIAALRSSGDHAIGTQPAAYTPPREDAPERSSPSHAPPTTDFSVPSGHGSGSDHSFGLFTTGVFVVGVFGFIVVVAILRAAARNANRSGSGRRSRGSRSRTRRRRRR